MMKKFLSIFVAMVMCLGFAGCGGKTDSESTLQQSVSEIFCRSGYDEISGSYYNSYSQLTVTPPSDWYIYRDSDLAAAYLNGKVTGDEFSVWGQSEYKKQTVIPDIAFQDMANSNNLSVVYVNLDMLEGGTEMDETAFLNLVAETKGTEGFGADQEMYATVCGRDFKLLQLTGESCSIYMLAKKQDNYMIVVTATDHTAAGREMFLGFIG